MIVLLKKVAYLESRLEASIAQEAANTSTLKTLINAQQVAKLVYVKKVSAGTEVLRAVSVEELAKAVFRYQVAKRVMDIPWWLLWTEDVKHKMHDL